MAKKAIKARKLKHFEDGQKATEEQRKAKERARRTGPEAFKGKVFSDLTGTEKDDLLKSLAVSAGILTE